MVRTVATDAPTLAHALATRLVAVVPAGISVVADGPSVVVASAGAGVSVDLRSLVEQEGDEDTNAELGARAVLDTVQDFVAEEFARPWPEGGAPLPTPTAAVEGGLLRLWYGDERRPALELPPIPLHD
jgi:hypothetical protein